jgi:X-X-X-Leu-X-X-Gly heptad repeat protein
MNLTDLPWNFTITYALNDQLITSNELAGKSGKLEIHIKSEQNRTITPEFYESYMLQISLTLDNEKCSNLSADGAIVAEAGNSSMLNLTVMPKKDADLLINCDVKDFEMKGVEITAMPFSLSMDLPDTETMLQDFHKLPQAISDLNDGVGDLAEGTTKLAQGAIEIKTGSTNFETGLAELKKNSTQITGASSKISSALTTISTSLTTNTYGADLTQLTQLPTVLNELSTGLKGIADGMDQLKDGYSKAYAALDTAIIAIPDTIITKEQIEEQFPDLKESQQNLLDQLYASYEASQTVKGTYNLSKFAFAQVEPTMETLSTNLVTMYQGLDEMSGKFGSELSSTDISTQLGMLSKGLTELASNYSEFDKGLSEYMKGISKLSDGYSQFDTGISEFVSGVGALDQGVTTLHEGTEQFKDETAKMPEMIQDEIDKLMKDYTGTKIQNISFVSPNNTNTELVQFVVKCDDIKKIKVSNTNNDVVEASKEETVWDRLVALFID